MMCGLLHKKNILPRPSCYDVDPDGSVSHVPSKPSDLSVDPTSTTRDDGELFPLMHGVAVQMPSQLIEAYVSYNIDAVKS